MWYDLRYDSIWISLNSKINFLNKYFNKIFYLAFLYFQRYSTSILEILTFFI